MFVVPVICWLNPHDLELLTIIWSIYKLSKYLFGRHFYIFSITVLPSGNVLRSKCFHMWSLLLSPYNYTVIPVPASCNRLLIISLVTLAALNNPAVVKIHMWLVLEKFLQPISHKIEKSNFWCCVIHNMYRALFAITPDYSKFQLVLNAICNAMRGTILNRKAW